MDEDDYVYQCYLEELEEALHYKQMIEYQQEIEAYPLFFWKETCNDNPD